MKLNVIGDPDGVETNEVDKNAMGGTELMKYALQKKIDPAILDKFQIIPSRVRKIEKGKIPILWLHDLPGDPESKHLADGGWDKFEKIVCVSHWQRQQYENHYGIPASKLVVLQNAIEPIPDHEKPNSKKCVNIIYHTTPHRGLELLIPVMDWLEENLKDVEWHLDVYSSFNIYGWGERDAPYKPLFDRIDSSDKMTNHGFVPNEEVHKALQKAHIFALPSIWPETSCIAMIEAMSAGCICVHSSLAALPETTANWSLMYDYSENKDQHATSMALLLGDAIQLAGDPSMTERMDMQKAYTDGFYNWDVRAKQWEGFLIKILRSKGIEL
jgi:UDP-glucose:(glucosyl)LPS alpha-1,2-glucosyltransferase